MGEWLGRPLAVLGLYGSSLLIASQRCDKKYTNFVVKNTVTVPLLVVKMEAPRMAAAMFRVAFIY